ncbi:hypothetical protein QQ045_013485 [Rhodiola kirilowii]
MILLVLSQSHLNSADESALSSLRKDLAHPLQHRKHAPTTSEASFGSIQKLRIHIKKRGGGGGGGGRFFRGRSGGIGTSAASSIIRNTVNVFYCEADSTSSSDTSTPIVKNNGGEWNEASGSLTVYRRGKATYGGSDLIPRKPAKNGAQCSLIRPASAITLLTGSAITLLCYLI